VNLNALTHLTRRFLPAMVERRRGGVLNVGSLAGFQPGPYMAVYYATKAYVLSLTEALAAELAGTTVTATCLAPGATQTDFLSLSQMDKSLLVSLGTLNARKVALAGYRGFRAGKTLVVPSFANRALVFAVRLAPRRLVTAITARLNRPLRDEQSA